jgi:hypothetical protein
MRTRAFVRSHRPSAVAGALIVVGAIVFVLLWFQPQKLIIEKTVNEAAPTTPSASTSKAPKELASGGFRSLEHHTTGSAHLIRLSDGSVIVRLEKLDTSNGPDVRVYLSSIPADRGMHAYGEGFIDLGALKGNRGNQNYGVPANTDLSAFRSVVIWCRRFTVGFAVAPLNRA